MAMVEKTNGPASRGFKTLWPTILLQRSLPGHEAANRVLLESLLARDAAQAHMTTDYLSGNLFTQDDPALRWLKDCVNKTVVDYLHHLGMNYPISWSLQAWANVNRLGDYHDAHNHPHAYLSGTYYLRVPEQPAAGETRKDLRLGAISFYDPRGAVNMSAIKDDPQIEAEYTVLPEAGEILLWPAFLFHFVHPNLAEEPRVSVSFNLVLKWSDAYLPHQD